MLRKLIGIAAGYLFAVIFTVLALWVVYSQVNTDWAFKIESFQSSTRWVFASIACGFIGAMIAGAVCFLISKSSRAVNALAGVFIVVGLCLAVFALTEPGVIEYRPLQEFDFIEAREKSRSPIWYNFLMPFVSAAGVIVGGGNRKEE
ncbi:MAG: hypothetical protein HKN33_09275 [Pyrinomonadaceae bacterium]|nr:hypothetical protein [Pyrinomonadaceae bacterium]